MTTIEILFSIISTALLLLCLGFYFNAYAFKKLLQKRSGKQSTLIVDYLSAMQKQIDIIISQQEDIIKGEKGRDLERLRESIKSFDRMREQREKEGMKASTSP
ncbi:hypothetical protein [Bartonella sp. DGB2]|uniref:hypothetical protein n=1 Tax=Bartonella sp. DGB2 TaxID=3388426 RepID=UPI00399005FC